MPSPRVLVLTPTYEECDNLPRFVESVWRVLPEADILVIDDASPDGTGQLAERLARGNPRLSVIHRSAKLGLGSAYVAGFHHALAHGYDVTFEMDTDLSHDARHLPSFLAELAAGADVVVGSRSVPGGGVVGWGVGRRLLSAGGSLYARAILGAPVRDMTTGYKAYSRRALEAIGVERLRTSGYAFQIETTYRALQAGLRVVEVPIVFLDRRVGRSKLSRQVFLEAVWAVWRLRFDDDRRAG
jgi:dolichol-phosphate mannosyltransferase